MSKGSHERRDARKAQARSEAELKFQRQKSEAPFREFFAGADYAGLTPGHTLLKQQEATQGLLDMIIGATGGEGALPYGMNAPGILEGLISRGREATDQRSQQAARQYQDLFPAIGGAAARGAADIYRRGASEAAELETGLRAKAAENALLDRLRLLAGASGAIPAIGAQANALQALGLPAELTMALAGAQGQYAQQMNQQAQQQTQAGAGLWGQLGSGLLGAAGAVGGSFLMPGVGTAAGQAAGQMTGQQMTNAYFRP